MTYAEALSWGQRRLEELGIGTARLDTLVLLEDSLGVDRAQVLAHPETKISPTAQSLFKKQVELRGQQMPLAYVRGKSEFYGYEFKIDRRVLEPRPESEALIDELGLVLDKATTVIDVGTGSGALIIVAKLKHPEIKAYATDISQDCLDVAAENAARHHVKVNWQCGDLIAPIPHRAIKDKFVLMANLPYVPDKWQINPPAMREPEIAIFGGNDGLNLYRKLFKQLSSLEVKA